MTAMLGWSLIAAGLFILAVAGVGLLCLPDALTRPHAATKAGTLGLACMLAGTALAGGHDDWPGELMVLALLLLLTLPVAGHALARMAHASRTCAPDQAVDTEKREP